MKKIENERYNKRKQHYKLGNTLTSICKSLDISLSFLALLCVKFSAREHQNPFINIDLNSCKMNER